jgi:hypothetical protein
MTHTSQDVRFGLSPLLLRVVVEAERKYNSTLAERPHQNGEIEGFFAVEAFVQPFIKELTQ